MESVHMPGVALAADWAAPTLRYVSPLRRRAATSRQTGSSQGPVNGH